MLRRGPWLRPDKGASVNAGARSCLQGTQRTRGRARRQGLEAWYKEKTALHPPRPFTTFVGIDLGGARGKTTAVATLTRRDDGVAVEQVATRRVGEPWHDESLWDYLSSLGPSAAIAI